MGHGVCVLQTYLGVPRSKRSITANFSWSYTYEVRVLASVCALINSPDGLFVSVRRCTFKSWTGDQLTLTPTFHDIPNASSAPGADRCDKTAFVEILFFVWCTQIAQTILNARYEMISPRHPFFSI